MSSKGFSLLEVLMAISVMTIAAFGVLTLVQSQEEKVSLLQDRLSHQDLKKLIDDMLVDNQSCTATFRKFSIPSSIGEISPHNISIKNKQNEIIFNSSNKNTFEKLNIKSIRLQNLDVGASATFGTGKLIVEVERQRRGGGPQSFRSLEYTIPLSVNPTDLTIHACAGSSSMGEWFTGEWVNLLNSDESHEDACARVGLSVHNSFALGSCASGEVRPRFGNNADKIKYIYGAWGGQSIVGGTMIVGRYCYNSGQKKDGDGTDRKVAVLCK